MIYSLVVQKWIEIRVNGVHVRAYWSGKNTAAMDEGTSPETVYRNGLQIRNNLSRITWFCMQTRITQDGFKSSELDGRGHEGRDQTFPGRGYGASTESTSLWSCRGLSPNLTETNIDAAIWAVTEDLRSTIKNTSSPCLYDHLKVIISRHSLSQIFAKLDILLCICRNHVWTSRLNYHCPTKALRDVSRDRL